MAPAPVVVAPAPFKAALGAPEAARQLLHLEMIARGFYLARRGYMSLSLGIVYEKYLIERADLVVLEINENLPWTLGDTHVHISDVDHVVENPQPLIELQVTPSSDWEKAIGGYISELIDDGSTLQLGIGGIPNAITAYIMERRDLAKRLKTILSRGNHDPSSAGPKT